MTSDTSLRAIGVPLPSDIDFGRPSILLHTYARSGVTRWDRHVILLCTYMLLVLGATNAG
jgi:hypothetical protein